MATKAGTGASTSSNNQVLRGTGTGTSAWDQVHGDTDIKNLLPASILANIYPVGAIYSETTGVNPGTTFGFGTWSQYAQGQVLVGAGTSDETFFAGATGGESNHTLITNEIPVHNHTIVDPGHLHGESISSASGAVTGITGTPSLNSTNTGIGLTTGSSTSGISVSTNGGGVSHNNLQPYVVVYHWRRTA